MNKKLMQIQLEGILAVRIVSVNQVIARITDYLDEYGEDEYIVDYSHRVKKEYDL